MADLLDRFDCPVGHHNALTPRFIHGILRRRPSLSPKGDAAGRPDGIRFPGMRSLILALAVSLGIGAAQAADRQPVVVELFTSQGCNSCPPADEFLGELAKRADVLALSLHVDYWDYIGWKDPFARRAHTERQRDYSRALSQRYVYTPQMVVNGALQGVGSDRAVINRLIEKARKAQGAAPALSVTGDGAQRTLRIGAAGAATAATVWLVGFDRRHETPVRAGENSGRRLANHNVVRTMQPIGTWQGQAEEIALDLSAIAVECDGAAVIVQAGETGPVVAATRVDLPKR
jgi:hypothetical protein